MLKTYQLLFCFLLILIPKTVSAQLCGGSFGNPVFTEDFGSVNTSAQVISGPLLPPAYISYTHYNSYPPNDGFYTVTNLSGENLGWGWHKSYDHTDDPAGTYGNMLIVNASYTPGEFYKRRVSGLCSNQVFRFSAWMMNLSAPSSPILPNVTMEIRSISGTVLGRVSTGDLPASTTAIWKNFFLDFRADAASSDVDVVMINNAPGGIGNDLAIDDITFSPCGPATTINSNISSITTSGICDNSQNLSLTAQINSNPYQNINYIWQKSIDNGVTWNNITLPSSATVLNITSGTYQNNDQYRFIVGEASNIALTNCQVISPPAIFKINGYPNMPTVQNFSFCQNSNPSPISASGSSLLWYISSTGGIASATAPIPNTSILGTVSYYVSQSVNGCESSRAKVDVTIKPNPSKPVVISGISFCQNSNLAPLTAVGTNLLWYSSASGGSGNIQAPIPDASKSGDFSFWVSQTVNGCESTREEIKVKILPAPHSTTLQDISICDGETKTLDAGSGFLKYVWNTIPAQYSQMISVSKTGNYTVTITDSNGCSASQTVKVTAGTTPIITEIYSAENSIKITATSGNPPYFYSLNGKDWQTENTFENLKPAVYNIFVKSQTNSCTAIAKTAVIDIPNVITPDGNGKNDIFTIRNISYFPKAFLQIFDRFGKLMYKSDDSNIFWDGTYDGRKVPTATYWYHLNLGNGYEKSGWILVKNVK